MIAIAVVAAHLDVHDERRRRRPESGFVVVVVVVRAEGVLVATCLSVLLASSVLLDCVPRAKVVRRTRT